MALHSTKSQPQPRTQHPAARPQPRGSHLVGISLEGRGEGCHSTQLPAREHGGTDQGPLLQGKGAESDPSPMPTAPPPQSSQLTSSRTSVSSGVLRVFRGTALLGAGTAGSSLAGGMQMVSGAGWGAQGPPPKYSQAGGGEVLALIRREPREVGALTAELQLGAARLWGTEQRGGQGSLGHPPFPGQGLVQGGGTHSPLPPGQGGADTSLPRSPLSSSLASRPFPGVTDSEGGA